MSQWGSSDAASNSVYWGPDLVKTRANTTTRDALYTNTTPDAFITGVATGVFAVDSTEEAVSTGMLSVIRIVTPGSGYSANATLTFSSNNTGTGAAGNTTVNTATGRIQSATVSSNGSGYTANPVITVSAPTAITFNGNSAVSNTTDTIAISTANSKFLAGDRVTYTVASGNTAVSGLTSGTNYYISFSNSSTVALSTTKGGANVNLTSGGPSETGHSLTGETATAQAVISGGQSRGIAHTGWVLRTEGSGGRAGRVQYEVLVAGGITSDGSDDQFIHDNG